MQNTQFKKFDHKTIKEQSIEKADKAMLHNMDLEQSLLYTLMSRMDAYDQVRELLHTDLFYAYRHQVIFQTIQAIKETQPEAETNIVVVHDRLLNKNNLDAIGGEDYLKQIFNGGNQSLVFKPQGIIERLEDLRIRRQGTQALNNALIAIKDMDKPANEVVNQASDSLMTATESITTEYADQSTLLGELLNELGQTSTETTFQTGLHELDQLIFMGSGDAIVVAGRPSMGKTSLALQICDHITTSKQLPVVIFSLEMPRTQIERRLLSRNGSVRIDKLYRTERLNEQDWSDITFGTQQLQTKSIYINDDRNISTANIHAQCNKIRRQTDGKLGAIMVDYLQIFAGLGTGAEKTNQIGEITRSLKAIAHECGCPVIMLSQLNRGVESRPDKRPMMSDLKDSGAIEQDADIIMGIYRDDYYNTDSKEPGIAEVIILKGRNTGTGTAKLGWDGSHCRFTDLQTAVNEMQIAS